MKKIVLCLLFCLLIGTITGCGGQKDGSMKNNQIQREDKTITFVTMPSPPKCKYVKNSDDVKQIINVIEKSEKKEVKNNNEKGWDMAIIIHSSEEETRYSFLGNIMSVDGKNYEIPQKIKEELKTKYESLNVKEEEYNA